MENNKSLNVMLSIILTIMSCFILFESFRIFKDEGVEFYASAGFMPAFLSILLLICSIILFVKNTKEDGAGKVFRDLNAVLKNTVKSGQTIKTVSGIAILALYTFILVPVFPFWMSGIIFLVFIMWYLNAASFVKVIIVSSTFVACVYIVFKVIFNVPLM